MKKSLFILGFAAIGVAANAQISYVGAPIFENFDGLTGLANAFSATAGVQAAIPGEGLWQGAKIGGTGTTGPTMFINNGSSATGGMYGYGPTGGVEFALGMLASGTNILGFGVEIVNNSGNALTSITLAFTQENWRSSTSSTNTPNTMVAAGGISGGTITSANFLTEASMGAFTTANLVGPTPVVANGALNGNDPINQVAKNATWTFTTPLAVGQSFYVRWQDFNDQGNDAGIAIDNMEITATAVPEPATLAALGLGAAALLRRRRK